MSFVGFQYFVGKILWANDFRGAVCSTKRLLCGKAMVGGSRI
ncbi:hypothetical protein RMSM_04027 [Rhodopirellula maiorica SM1]|uniref:Uncharacterized protein n=1 Tax=Rhodopirellula maiorica SM1 TaxID=1265738 RepID=M5RIM3_9BACT|nr:hypothetical protein RMSM_04027 [Rhodopirellula maiorica SM1]